MRYIASSCSGNSFCNTEQGIVPVHLCCRLGLCRPLQSSAMCRIKELLRPSCGHMSMSQGQLEPVAARLRRLRASCVALCLLRQLSEGQLLLSQLEPQLLLRVSVPGLPAAVLLPWALTRQFEAFGYELFSALATTPILGTRSTNAWIEFQLGKGCSQDGDLPITREFLLNSVNV